MVVTVEMLKAALNKLPNDSIIQLGNGVGRHHDLSLTQLEITNDTLIIWADW